MLGLIACHLCFLKTRSYSQSPQLGSKLCFEQPWLRVPHFPWLPRAACSALAALPAVVCRLAALLPAQPGHSTATKPPSSQRGLWYSNLGQGVEVQRTEERKLTRNAVLFIWTPSLVEVKLLRPLPLFVLDWHWQCICTMPALLCAATFCHVARRHASKANSPPAKAYAINWQSR